MNLTAAILWAAPLVAFLGYVSHRASLCTVRAMAALLRHGSLEKFAGFVQAVLWALVVTVPATAFFSSTQGMRMPVRSLWVGLSGALLFGLGAALNKGCSFSTLQRLADGDWRMLLTLLGYGCGSAACHQLALPFLSVGSAQLPPIRGIWPGLATVILWGWALSALMRMGRRHALFLDPVHGVFSPAATGLLLGLGASALYLGFGPWTYTNTLQAGVGALFGARPLPPLSQLILVPFLFGGMVVSAWQRKRSPRMASSGGWVFHLVGGLLMGIGGTLIPGGNDTLLLRLIPGLTPGSVWIYLALLLGVAIGLVLRRPD